eukprot:Seg2163.9 transcript_id=Seg2163.9/GoldUCD/mRNA.D3Y31 product="hypothetical protein" protein_id=Seg2163.9/GoldUCD/D3Y31
MDNNKLITLFFAEFFILLLCCGYSWMQNVERRSGSGDIFAKNWPRLNLTIQRCDLDVSGSGHANDKNITFCNCNWGETFFVSLSRRPKCMKAWGQNQTLDLGCKFLFKDSIYVLALTIDKSKETIGQVIFGRSDGRKSQLTKYSLNKTSLWNVTWQQPDEKSFDLNSNGSLRWNGGSHVSTSQRYSGALFKFDVVAYDTETGKFQSSCLLLKIAGVRKYPLTLPKIESESSFSTPIQFTSFATTPTETISSISLTKLQTTNFVESTQARTTTSMATNTAIATNFISTTQAKTRSNIKTTSAEMNSSMSVSYKISPISTSSFIARENTSLLVASKFLSTSSLLQPTKIVLSKSSHIKFSSTLLIQPTKATSSFSTLSTTTVWKNTDNTKFQKGNDDIMAPLIVGILSPCLFILLIFMCLLIMYKKIKSKNRAEILQASSSRTTEEVNMKPMPTSQQQYVQSWCEKHMNEPNIMQGEESRSTQCLVHEASVGDDTTNGKPSKITENINQLNDNNHDRNSDADSSHNHQQNGSTAPEGPSKDLTSTTASIQPIRPITKLPPLLVKPIIANQPIIESNQSCLDDCSPIIPITVSQGTSNLTGLPTSRPKLPPLERTNKSNILPNVDIDG